jgi:hypothetical protein
MEYGAKELSKTVSFNTDFSGVVIRKVEML